MSASDPPPPRRRQLEWAIVGALVALPPLLFFLSWLRSLYAWLT